MAIDFPLRPLRRFLWDHLSEIIPDHHRQRHPQEKSSSGGGGSGSSSGSGISSVWAAGTGHEGFDGFRITLKKFSSGQSNPTFLLVVHLSPPPAAAAAAASSPGAKTAAATPTLTPTPPAERATIEHDGDDAHTFRFVLRKKPASVKVSSAHAVEREFRILRALRQDASSSSDAPVPVPRALLLCEDPAVVGTAFYVMEFVKGRIFSDAALPGLRRAERAAAYESAAETLARLHRVDFVAADLEGFGRSKGGYLERQVATLERVAAKQAEDAGPIEGFGEVVRDLRDLTVSGNVVPNRVTIVHGDFRIDNLVFHPVEPRVIAVLDWELSTLGHPLADLANLCILHHLPASAAASASARGGSEEEATAAGGEAAAAAAASAARMREKKLPTSSTYSSASTTSPLAGLKGLDLEALGIPRQSALMEVYRRATAAAAAAAAAPGGEGGGGVEQALAGVDGPGVAELGLAFVFFKMAVIAHGVKARLSRGVASSAQASLVSAMVPTMIALAVEQISALKHILAENIDGHEGSGGGGGGSSGGSGGSGSGSGSGSGKASPCRSPLLPPPKAVLFDVGGVLSESPLLAIARFERESRPRLPPSYVGVAISAAGEGGLFQRLERGEERLGNGFLKRFAEYLCSDEAKRAYVDWYVARWTAAGRGRGERPLSLLSSSSLSTEDTASQHSSRRTTTTSSARAALAVPRAATNVVHRSDCGGDDSGAATREEAKTAVARVVAVDVLELFQRITEAARVPVPEMFAAAEALRRQGFKVGVVSNDFMAERGFVLGRWRRRLREKDRSEAPAEAGAVVAAVAPDATDSSGMGGSVYSRLPALCDAVVLSSRSGCRKPGGAIYVDACEALGISTSEAVFVDDIRVNIQAAEALGMRTVWVEPGSSVTAAISGLQAVTGAKLVASKLGERGAGDWGGGVRRPASKL
ncbi:unnamed protein product [Pylaiella littoralis]